MQLVEAHQHIKDSILRGYILAHLLAYFCLFPRREKQEKKKQEFIHNLKRDRAVVWWRARQMDVMKRWKIRNKWRRSTGKRREKGGGKCAGA